MAAPAGSPEVVAASADDVHPAESDAVAAAVDDIVEAEGYGADPDAGSRAGRTAALAAVQATNQVVATTTADPQHADAHAAPQPLAAPSEASADEAHPAEEASDHPDPVHDDVAADSADASHDDGAAATVHDDVSDGSEATE